MIEVFSMDCSRSLGQYPTFKAARATLERIALAGMLGNVPSVRVCRYRRDMPEREYVTTYSRGGWRRCRNGMEKRNRTAGTA